jgi:hypothetical protein
MSNVPPNGERRTTRASEGVERASASTRASGNPLTLSGRAAKGRLQFSKRQIVLAIAIAGISDVLCAFVIFAPPVVWTADVITALLLFAVLGWHWLLLPGLVLEAIPGFGVIPFWLLVVGAILVWGTARPKLK